MEKVKLDINFYEQLLKQAEENPRLRQAYDLRNGSDDTSQRLLNALIPGTIIPIHRHTTTIETVVVLYGEIDEIFYDNTGKEFNRIRLYIGDGMQIPKSQFHSIQVIKPSILLEFKDGKYTPLSPVDIL